MGSFSTAAIILSLVVYVKARKQMKQAANDRYGYFDFKPSPVNFHQAASYARPQMGMRYAPQTTYNFFNQIQKS